jgi:predicted RNase H-like HicB family nuclease
MQYLVVIEEGKTRVGAYAPDLSGCVAVGKSREEALAMIQEAIALHLKNLQENGKPIPRPTSSVEYIEVQAP